LDDSTGSFDRPDLSLVLLVDDRWSSVASLVELQPVSLELLRELAPVLAGSRRSFALPVITVADSSSCARKNESAKQERSVRKHLFVDRPQASSVSTKNQALTDVE